MIVYSEKYLEHNNEHHPENNQRLRAIMNYLTKKDVFEKVALVEPSPAKEEDILRAHTKEHLERIKSFHQGMIDADTYFTEKSYETAMLAAGGLLKCVDNSHAHNHSFALVRPPGHHAESGRAMGFCLFNNVAIGVRHAMHKYKIRRVFILDFDVHHGNGTQEIFYSTPGVLFLSLHQYPFYPGTGSIDEINRHAINIPLPPGTGDKSYLRACNEIVFPVMKEFGPELVFVSAGYDGHHDDPLGGMRLTERCYYEISKRLVEMRVKTIFSLEGGYNLDALAKSVHATMSPLFDLAEEPLEKSVEEEKKITDYAESRLNIVKERVSKYWKI